MKPLFSTLTLLLLYQLSFAQLPPWNLEFYVYHPDGYTDTLWVGCDENATAGYDEGLDIIDTTFNTPIAIRGFSQEVEDEFNFGACVNLKKDIRPFGYPAEFTFYIMHDSIGATEPSNSAYLGWDTSTLNYEVGDFWIEGAVIYSTYGYLEGIDGTERTLGARGADSIFDYLFQPIQLFSLAETLPCFNNYGYSEYYLKIVLKAYFKDYSVFVDENNVNLKDINIFANLSLGFLQIQSQLSKPVKAHIYNNTGQVVDRVTIIPGEQKIDISNLTSGIYYINVSSGLFSNPFTYKFIKK